MNYLEAIVLGSVQGLTEFLPVSSSGHLFLMETYLGLVPSLSFELYLHIGTLIAVLLYFYKDIHELLVGLWRMLVDRKSNDDGVFALQLAVATALTLPTALVIKKSVLDGHLSVALVGATLVITALLILASEYVRKETTRPLSWGIMAALGLVQGLALIPGISRSGLTIAFLLIVGINRNLAARTSFLLSIPTIVGAGVFAFADSSAITDMTLSPAIVLGVIASAIVGYAGIAWMMRLVEGKWIYFVPYCGLLGAVLLLI